MIIRKTIGLELDFKKKAGYASHPGLKRPAQDLTFLLRIKG